MGDIELLDRLVPEIDSDEWRASFARRRRRRRLVQRLRRVGIAVTAVGLVAVGVSTLADRDDTVSVSTVEVQEEPGVGPSETPPSAAPDTRRPDEPKLRAPGPQLRWDRVESLPESATLVYTLNYPVAVADSGKVLRFEVASGEWKPVADLPSGERIGAELVSLGGGLVALWGGRATETGESRSDGYIVDLWEGSVTAIPEAPFGSRFRPSVVWTGTELIVWGGADSDGKPSASGASFNRLTEEWKVLPESPLSARSDHEAVWNGTEMLVWGGCGDTEDVVQCDDFVTGDELGDGAAFDPAAMSWRPIAPAPFTPRDKAQAVWANFRMVVVGGRSDAMEGESPVYMFDPETDSWQGIGEGAMPNGLTGFGIADMGRGRVLIGGGILESSVNDVYLVDVPGGTLTELTSADWTARDRLQMVAVDDRRVLVAGGCCNAEGRFLADAYVGQLTIDEETGRENAGTSDLDEAPELEIPLFEMDEDGRSFGRLDLREDQTFEEALAAAPDFTAVLSRDGRSVPGFVKTAEMYGLAMLTGDIEVFARDGKTVVGHWINGLGFVGLDEDPADIEASGRELLDDELAAIEDGQ